MAKPLRGECEVDLAGKKYKLRLGIGELEELDNITGLGTLALAQALSTVGGKISLSLAVLGQAMHGDNGKKMPPARVRQIVENAGFTEANRAAVAILSACLVDPNEGNAEASEETPVETPTGA